MAWRNKASCLKHVMDEGKPDYWDKVSGDRFSPSNVSEAKRICFKCPVREECLDDALDKNETFGIRGGFTPRERQRLSRAM